MNRINLTEYQHSHIYPIIKASSLDSAKISVVNMQNFLCHDSADCSSVADGKFLFRDSSHLSREGSMVFYEPFSGLIFDNDGSGL